ncbi:amidohydrolase family protein [Bradyrhizobium genosp. P]|uniref:amidohydrolase family protein n=1 Tax=Bradyrhizobium genosp. P TaxID=83641 RepID=UPI003CEB4E95
MKDQLLVGATIIDGTGGPTRQQEALLIKDGMIKDLGHRAEIAPSAPDADLLDLSGLYMTPGFINTHDHVFSKREKGIATRIAAGSRDLQVFRALRNAISSLSEGVTTLRDAGSMDDLGLDVKKAINSRIFVGPRMQAVSQGLTVTGGYAHQFFLEVDSVIEVRKAVGEMIKRDVDWVKCMASIEWSRGEGEPISAVNMSTELMRDAFDIAHLHGKRCMAHAVCNESIVNALDARVDSIEHGVMLDEPTAERMAHQRVFLVPTLSTFREKCNDWGRGPGAMRHGESMRPYHDRSIRFARSAGVKMAYGSDNFGNLVDEIRGLQQLGFSLMECLVLATRSGAELLGIQDQVGTIEKGKCADLVVLGRDPLSSPEAFGDVRLVFRDGRKINPSQLPI